jgi:hypothetical protein
MGRGKNGGKSILGLPANAVGTGASTASQSAVVSNMLHQLNVEIRAVGSVTTVNDIQRILAIFNTIITASEDPGVLTNMDIFGLNDYDPFNLSLSSDLNNITLVLQSLSHAFEIVQVVLKQKGFVASGLNVAVPIAKNPVNLIM